VYPTEINPLLTASEEASTYPPLLTGGPWARVASCIGDPITTGTETAATGGSEYRLLNDFLHSGVISRNRVVELPPRLTDGAYQPPSAQAGAEHTLYGL
jgi:hypothetical protein